MSNVLKEAALKYANMGLAVFPLKPNSKFPAVMHGVKEATTNTKSIERWWKLNPEYNIGIATGTPSGGVCVIDVDVNDEKGVDGRDSISEWESDNENLPDTAISITGRGGYHYFYRFDGPQNNRTGIIDGVDFRGDGGYIVAPPSVHSNGREYEWEYDIEEYPIADANETITKLISSRKLADTNGNALENYEKFDIDKEIAEGRRNDGLYKLASHYQSLSYADSDIRVLVHAANKAKCVPPLEDDEVDKLLGSALGLLGKGKSEEFKKKGKRSKSETIKEMVDAIESDELLSHGIRYNSLAYSPWYCGILPWGDDTPVQKQWTDVDDANFQAYMESEYGFKSPDKMMKALRIVMDKNTFSPIVEHLESLKGKWDGVPRVDTLLQDYLGAGDTELNRTMMRLFMYGAIARAYKPGCQFDYMLVLTGEQGIGKSTFFRRLAMRDVWFDGNFNCIDGDRAVEKLRGMWILEMSEMLAQKRAKDVESMKSFITSREDNYRAPYDRRTTSRPRQCVFTGSTNTKIFLTDMTGNRRFLPVEVHESRVKKSLFASDIDEYFEQTWAEAIEDYFAKEPALTLNKEQTKQLIDMQQEFTEEFTEVGIIQEYLDGLKQDRTCALDIWRNAMHEAGTPDRKSANMIHLAMQSFISGWVAVKGKKRCREFGVQRCYEREGAVQEAWEEVEYVPF